MKYRLSRPLFSCVSLASCCLAGLVAGVLLGRAAPGFAQGSVETDRRALMALYDATDGDHWRFRDGWDDRATAALDTLFGVTTNSAGRVIYLDLARNNLRGSLPDFSALPHLTYLYLGGNRLSGPIPDFSNLPHLTSLSLAGNELSGPIPDFSALPRLAELYLQGNRLSGSIPDFSALPRLAHLSLGNNELSGPLPASFGRLPLYSLSLQYNFLSGPLPDTWSALTNLRWLEIGYTKLCVPQALEDWYYDDISNKGTAVRPPCSFSFGGAPIADQTYTVGEEIEPLALPLATGGTDPLTYTLTGTLPAGLRFIPIPRLLLGTPTTSGFYTVAYVVTDANGYTVPLTFNLTVNAASTDGTDTGSGGPPSPGVFEIPPQSSYQSGIGVISGWVCEANTVEIRFTNGQTGAVTTLPAAYGTSRTDTVAVCEDADNGFGLLWNWNRLGDGRHTVRAFADGNLLDTRVVTVTTLGEEVAQGLSGEFEVIDFPAEGMRTRLKWEEAQQGFVLAAGPGGGEGWHRDKSQAVLENPQPASFQSGIGVISGWVCEADSVEVELTNGETGEVTTLATGYGTSRTDTERQCGDIDNGFGLLFNWNQLGDGRHTVRALADGVEFARSTFTVTTLGEEFVRGLRRWTGLDDFPAPGMTTTLVWQEAAQNFVLAWVGPSPVIATFASP